MENYHDALIEIKNCKSEKQLLKVVEAIVANSKKLDLDETDLQRLEEVGMHKYEQFERERRQMVRNKKGK